MIPKFSSYSQTNDEELQSVPDSKTSRSSTLRRENSKYIDFNCVSDQKKATVFKKSHSFVEEYEDLLTKLTKNTNKKAEDGGSVKSFNNLGVFDKIKPRLRSFLILSHPIGNQSHTQNSHKVPRVRINRILLEIRRKSCGCSHCGGLCKKLDKVSDFLTEKESKIVIENQQKLYSKFPEEKKEIITPQLNKKHRNWVATEDRRSSIEDSSGKSGLFKPKRNTTALLETKRDSLEKTESETIKTLKYANPLRAKLNSILNYDKYTPVAKSKRESYSYNQSALSNRNSTHKKSLKEVSETTMLPALSSKTSKGLSSMIQDKIKTSAQKYLKEDSPLNVSIKKILKTKKEDKFITEKLKMSNSEKDLNPYNNQYFFSVAKKLALMKKTNLTNSQSFTRNSKIKSKI